MPAQPQAGPGTGRPRSDHSDGHPQPEVDLHLDVLALGFGEAVGVAETLHRIADYSVASFPDVEGAVVTLADRSVRAAFGVRAALFADDLEVKLHEGPGHDALVSRSPVTCGSLGGSTRWRRFGPRAGRMGLHSVLAMPMARTADPVAVLVVYSARRDAFGSEHVEQARHFASPTAAVVSNAMVLEETQRRVEQLTEALRVRPVIDQALGILMSRSGKTAPESLDDLRRLSNSRHVKVVDLAAELVDEAVRRAKRRSMAGGRAFSAEWQTNEKPIG